MTDVTHLARDISDALVARQTNTHGSRRLLLAVLEDALLDAGRLDHRGDDARRYLADPRTDHLFAFRSICDELDLKPSTLHAFAKARYGRTTQRGEYRQVAFTHPPPPRRILSALLTRQCIACPNTFTSTYRQQHACSRRCARVAKRQMRRSVQICTDTDAPRIPTNPKR